MKEHSKNSNKEGENISKYQREATEIKNTIIGLKNTPERFNSKLDEGEQTTQL